MRRVMSNRLISFVFVCVLALSGCPSNVRSPARLSMRDLPYSFSRPPYIHPKIIEDLSTWDSDTGDQVTAINLLDSQDSNRYFGDILTRKTPGSSPFVYVMEEVAGSQTKAIFGYRYIGTTRSGIHVLCTSSSGGGSGVFVNLMLLTLHRERGLSCDWGKLSVHPGEERIVLHKVGEIGLGDRWDGELRVEGDKIFVGKDHGWFTASGGKGGGWLSYDRKDRILSIDIDRQQDASADTDKPRR